MPSSRDRLALAALAALLILRFPGVAAGVAAFSGSDHAWVNLPFHAAARDAFLAGEAPLWDKSLSCGSPLLAQGEAGAFYAGHALLDLPIELDRSYGWTLLAHLLALAAASYALFRRFGCAPSEAGALAAVLGLSPYVLYNLPVASFFETLWLAPVALLCWDLARRGAPVLAGAAGGLALGEQMLCGRPEWIHYWAAAAAAAAVHAVSVPERRTVLRRLAIFFSLTLALGIALGAVQWLPTRAFLPWSSRGGALADAFAARGSWLSWRHLYLVFLFPCIPAAPEKLYAYTSSNPWVGIVPFVLAVAGASTVRRDRTRALPALAAAAAGLLLALGPATPGLRWLWTIPPLSMLRFPGRSLPVYFCGTLVLAGLGWAALRRRDHGLPWRPLAVGASIVAAGIVVFALEAGAYAAPVIPLGRAILEIAPLAACLAIPRLRSTPRALDVAILAGLAIQATAGYRVPSFTEPRSALSSALAVVAPAAEAPVGERRLIAGALDAGSTSRNSPALGNGAILAGAEVVDEYQSFTMGPWREFLHAELHPRIRGEAALPPPESFCDLTGASWMLLPASRAVDDPNWERAAPAKDPPGPVVLWKRRTRAPLATLAHEAIRAPGPAAAAVAAAVRAGTVDFSRQVILEPSAPEPPRGGTPAASESVRELGAGTNAWSFEVEASSPGWLLVRDQMAPGWSATLDDVPVPILLADGFFKAVAMSAGAHRVEMRYDAPGFGTGAGISAVALVAIALVALVGRRTDGAATP